MYRIDEAQCREERILLIPAMLDVHFPLLKYAFYSKKYRPVILQEEKDIAAIGLQYTHNDMCYPLVLIIGQMITALRSGQYDLQRTTLMIPQAGDACRGSNYLYMIRKALKKAGFEQVPVISLNVKGLEKGEGLPISLGMLKRALAALFYGDLLMILSNQTRPYEKNKGASAQLAKEWTARLQDDLKAGRHLHQKEIIQRFEAITKAYSELPLTGQKLKKVGIVGELYMKYCHLGNWHLERYLQQENCEYYIAGLSWYALYYMDTHLTFNIVFRQVAALQGKMCQILKKYGFYVMAPYPLFKQQSKEVTSYQCSIGDGWLIAAEIAAHERGGYHRILAVQPFGCLPNQICGKGCYPYIQRKLPNIQLTSIDMDSSSAEVNIRNRIQLLLKS